MYQLRKISAKDLKTIQKKKFIGNVEIKFFVFILL